MDKIEYIPFLKLKRGEISAISKLDNGHKNKITPFFDCPKKAYDELSFISTINKLIKSLGKNADFLTSFYLDNFDIDDTFKVNNEHNYAFLISRLQEFPFIPVIGIDRSPSHNSAVYKAKKSGIISSEVVAIRITHDDFQDFDAISDLIKEKLYKIIPLFSNIDLILDCRLCLRVDPDKISAEITKFINKFNKFYDTRKIIIAGSSIPASIRDVVETESDIEFKRIEIEIFKKVISQNLINKPIIFGDYGIVSPSYSDVNLPGDTMQSIIAAKIIYTFKNKHFVVRGGKLQKKGRSQYFDMAKFLCSKPFYRGANYSYGDQYFEEKSRRVGSNCGPNTLIKPSVNAHITFMLNEGIS